MTGWLTKISQGLPNRDFHRLTPAPTSGGNTTYSWRGSILHCIADLRQEARRRRVFEGAPLEWLVVISDKSDSVTKDQARFTFY